MFGTSLNLSCRVIAACGAACALWAGTVVACDQSALLAKIGVLAAASSGQTFGTVAQAVTPQLAVPASQSPAVDEPAIVGLWKVEVYLQGSLIDERSDNWFADHNELFIDFASPIYGNVCNGVWKQAGRRTFKLNHVSYNFDGSGNPVNKAFFHDTVTLSRDGNSFTAIEDIDVYNLDGSFAFNVAGITTVASRVTVDF